MSSWVLQTGQVGLTTSEIRTIPNQRWMKMLLIIYADSDKGNYLNDLLHESSFCPIVHNGNHSPGTNICMVWHPCGGSCGFSMFAWPLSDSRRTSTWIYEISSFNWSILLARGCSKTSQLTVASPDEWHWNGSWDTICCQSETGTYDTCTQPSRANRRRIWHQIHWFGSFLFALSAILGKKMFKMDWDLLD